MNVTRTVRNRKERGVAMLVALLAVLLLAAIGIGFMFMAETEDSVNNNYRDSQKAYFASRAGLENVRLLLGPGGTLYAKAQGLDGNMPDTANTAGIVYVLNPTGGETIDPGDNSQSNTYKDDELCQEQFLNGAAYPFGAASPGVRCSAPSGGFPIPTALSAADTGIGTAPPLLFKWVRVTNKQNFMGLLAAGGPSSTFTADGTTHYGYQVCFDGSTQTAVAPGQTCVGPDPANPKAYPVWLLTSLAVTPGVGSNPGSRRITQMEVATSPPLNVPGTVSTQAPITLNGASTSVNGFDYCSCDIANCTTTTTGNGNNAVQTTTCAALPGKTCNATHHAVYTANTVNTDGNVQAFTNFGDNLTTTASVQNVNPWPYNTDQLINQYKSSATNASFNSGCTGAPDFAAVPPVYAQCGTQSGQMFGGYPTVNSTTGLLDPSTAVPQITYVAGSVHLTSSPQGAGVLIIDGDVQIDGGMLFYGLVLVRGSVTFSGGGVNKTNINGAILAGLDITNKCTANQLTCDVGDTIGGSVTLQYDLCALKNTASKGPPRLLAIHELQY